MPPSLAWIPAFCASTSFPMDQAITAECRKTVNPLTYEISLTWGEPISTKSAQLVWNLFQMWAAKNKVQTTGKVSFDARGERYAGMSVVVLLKERLGHPREERP